MFLFGLIILGYVNWLHFLFVYHLKQVESDKKVQEPENPHATLVKTEKAAERRGSGCKMLSFEKEKSPLFKARTSLRPVGAPWNKGAGGGINNLAGKTDSINQKMAGSRVARDVNNLAGTEIKLVGRKQLCSRDTTNRKAPFHQSSLKHRNEMKLVLV